MITNLSQVLLFLVYCIIVLYVVIRYQAIIWNKIKDLQVTLIRGPRKYKDCRIQHMIAASEYELYGKIMSDTVQDHLDSCNKYKVYYPKPQTRLPDPGRARSACFHEWSGVSRTISGNTLQQCQECHSTRTVSYHDLIRQRVLPNPVIRQKE